MSDIKDNKDGQDTGEKFDLYTEKIVSSPWNKIKKILKHIAKVVGSAVLFAVVACGVALLIMPTAKKFMPKEEETTTRNPVIIPTDSQTYDEPDYTDDYTEQDSEPVEETSAPLGGEEETSSETASEGEGETETDELPAFVKNEELKDKVNEIVGPAFENYKPGIEQYDALHDSVKAKVAEINKSMVTVSVTNEGNSAEYVDFIESVGVIVAEDDDFLYIMTSSDTVKEKNNIFITFADGTMAYGNVVNSDPVTGITILSCDKNLFLFARPSQVQTVALGNSYSVQQADPLIAIGTLFGYSESVVNTYAIATKNTIEVVDANYRLLVTDMAASGDEDGFLFNIDGALVGIIIPAMKDEQVVRAYAISELKPLIERLINDKDTPYIGVHIQNVTATMINAFNMPKGVYVDSVEADSPAFTGGIQNGDIIVSVGDAAVTNAREFQSAVFIASEEETIVFGVYRASKEGYREIDLTIEMR